MFPFFEVLGLKMYMTWIWIVVFLLSFIIVSRYLCYKWHQDFYKLFYWLPIAILITYFMWSYVQFFLNFGLIPQSVEELKILFSPYWYNFHFVWLLIWFMISIVLFFKKIQRYETKRIWADILFLSLWLSFVPLWIFLMLGDNFIGKPNSWFFSLKPLTTESELNKFNGVYPIGLFMSVMSIFVVLLTYFIKKQVKHFGAWILWFVFLIIWMNVTFMFQQYPRYGIMTLWWITFDVKHYISFFVIMYCLHIYYKREYKIKASV